MRCVGLVLLLTSLPATAGDRRGLNEPGPRQVAAFKRQEKVKFKECADEKCLEAAFQSCSPAHLVAAFTTIEGTPAVFDSFVVSRAEGCRIVEFADYSKDEWGGCAVRKTVCPNMKAAHSDSPESLGCTPSEVLHKPKICKSPVP